MNSDVSLDLEKWRKLPADKQILNIASELSRAKKWLAENNEALVRSSLERAFDLVDASAETARADGRYYLLRELLRLREFLGEFYSGSDLGVENFIPAIKNLLDLNIQTHELHLEL